MKHKEDLRLTFIEINSSCVGICVCDARHPYGYAGTEPFRKCIEKYLEMVGFESIRQYMMALPSYYGEEKETLIPPFELTTGKGISFKYDVQDKRHPLYFVFSYLDAKKCENSLLRYVNASVKVDMQHYESRYVEIVMIPRLHEVRRFFNDVDDSKLWFCEDWVEK